VWPEGDLENTSFRVFKDAEMRQLIDTYPGPDGSAVVVLPPGEYYVMAVVDANGNNEVDAGDAFGFHGVADLSAGSAPGPVTVAREKLNAATIPILMVRAEDGRLVPLPSALQGTTGTLTGSVAGATEPARPTLIVALPVGMQTRPVVAVAGDGGGFALTVPAGMHTLVAIADADDSGTMTPADAVATLGSAEAPIAVKAEEATALEAPLELTTEQAAPEGLPAVLAGRITGATIPEGGRASVAFCTDAQLRNEAFSVAADTNGSFAAVAEPGTYYVRVTIDREADGELGAGDMMGFFGVADLLGGDEPAAVEVAQDTLRTGLDIAISARIDEDGRLRAYTAEADAANDAAPNAGE